MHDDSTDWSNDESQGSLDTDNESGSNDSQCESDDSEEGNTSNDDEDVIVDDSHLPLFHGAPLSLGESILAILVFALRHKISGVCLADLLKLLSIHLPRPNHFLKTLYRFKKFFKNVGTPLVRHFYCSTCMGILSSKNSRCTRCPESTSPSYFLEIPILDQLRTLFKRRGFYNSLNYRFTREKLVQDNFEDIYDGEVYKTFFDNGFLAEQSNISFTWNTDGIPLFKSSKFSIWPYYFMINELPHGKRTNRENLILAGIWFGDKKPNANLFVNIFREPLQKLYQGVNFKVSDVDAVLRVRGVVVCGTCDLPAKALFLNMVQYNGTYGCQKCKIKTNRVGNTRVYPYRARLELRTSNESNAYAREAVETGKSVKGVKGPTVLSQISHDYITTTTIDIMHCVFLGIVKKLTILWFDSEYSRSDFSLYRFVHLIDERIQSLCPPSIIQRFPRKLSEIAYWKASELKTWLLYYSIPLLHDLMDKSYFDHYKLLVFAISLLNLPSISHDMIDRASLALNKYVSQFASLYTMRHMTPNLHLLLHLPDVVKSFGPLWVTSCFPFENVNGLLKSLVHGTRYAPLQIHASISIFANLSDLKYRFINPGSDVEAFCDYIDKRNTRRRKTVQIGDQTYAIGIFTKLTSIPIDTRRALHEIGVRRWIDIYSFTRLLKYNMFYNSSTYKRLRKYNSSIVKFCVNDMTEIGIVHTFLKVSFCNCGRGCENCNNISYFAILTKCGAANVFNGSIPNSTIKSIFRCTQENNGNPIAVPIINLKSVCFHAEISNELYVMEPINTIEFE